MLFNAGVPLPPQLRLRLVLFIVGMPLPPHQLQVNYFPIGVLSQFAMAHALTICISSLLSKHIESAAVFSRL